LDPVRPDTLAFLAPGLLHQLGNVLFTIQGNAQTLADPRDGGGRERAAILAASERGGQALRLLRCLLGDPAAPPVQAGVVLTQLGDLLRVPLREVRQLLELRHTAAQTPVFVAPTDFCIAVAEALRSLVTILPTGVHGTLVLDLCDHGPRHATVRVLFAPPAGALPFPLDVGELLARYATGQLRTHSRPVVRAHAMGLELVFPAAGGSQAAQA
jgi:hypothetical protein